MSIEKNGTTEPLPKLRPMHKQSDYRGVKWDKRLRLWAAQRNRASSGYTRGGLESLGLFYTDWEAALAYDRRIRELYGPEGLYNFPAKGEQSVFCIDECCTIGRLSGTARKVIKMAA